jgi:phytoene desaturase
MAGEISRLCGPREADGYLRFAEHARKLWQLERADFIERNLDSPRDMLTANLLRLAVAGGFRRLQSKIDGFFRDPRTRRVFSFQALYAGLAPRQALGLYSVITYMDSVAGVYFPRGGIHAVPRALAAAGEKHGVRFRYQTTVSHVEIAFGRATGVVTEAGELIRRTSWCPTRAGRLPRSAAGDAATDRHAAALAVRGGPARRQRTTVREGSPPQRPFRTTVAARLR